jgi:integrase
MQGHLRQMSENKWFVRVSAGKHPITGKRIQKSRVVRGSRADARKALHQLGSQRLAGNISGTTMTLNELVDAWLKAPTKGGRRRAVSTAYHDGNKYRRYVLPTMGSKNVDDIRPVEFNRLYQSLLLDVGLSPRSVHHIHSILRAAINWGWRQEFVASQAIMKVVAPNPPLPPPRAPDTRVVLGHLEGLQQSNPDLWLAVFLAASMGLRRSEIAGLRWSHIDLSAKTLTVCEGIVKIPGHGAVATATKTGLHGYARFDLHQCSFDALVSRYSELGQRLMLAGETLQSDRFVISCDPLHERPVDPDLLTKWLRKHCAKQYPLEPITFQSLRKFTSSALEGGGVDETTASALLRDRPETVNRHYRAAQAARVRSATLKLGDLLSQDIR